jgi:sporulation protein YabP
VPIWTAVMPWFFFGFFQKHAGRTGRRFCCGRAMHIFRIEIAARRCGEVGNMPEERRPKGTEPRYERHDIVMVNRQTMEVTGVMNVESFDSHEFVLKTAYGFLSIRGNDLHIKSLNLEDGIVHIEGIVFDIGYFDEGMSTAEKAKGLFSKLFR